MQTVRKDRVSQALQQEIASIVQFELKDPGVGFLTITKVELSSDLTRAKVGFSCLGDAQERSRAQEALDRAAKYVRRLIKKRLPLKIIPEIVFRFDESVAQSIAISAKLDELKIPPTPASTTPTAES